MSANYFKAIAATSIATAVVVLAAMEGSYMMIFVGSAGIGLAMDQMYHIDRD